jgi:hypothetical protein
MSLGVESVSLGPARAVPKRIALRAGIWLLASSAITVAAFPLALVVGVSVRPDFGWAANVVFYAAGSLAWLLLAFVGSVIVARLLSLGARGDARAGSLVVMSIAAGTFLCLAYGGWVHTGYGSSDPDDLGIGILIPAAAVVCALHSALGVVTVRPASLVSLVLSTIAYGSIVVMGILNLPGLEDGLSRDGLVLTAASIALGLVVVSAFKAGPGQGPAVSDSTASPDRSG